MAGTMARKRDKRIEVRATAEERALIDRAVAETGTDLTDFVITHASEAARRVLADRRVFVLDDNARTAWEALNSRPARELPGVAALFARPSPFVD